jgi:hypothetical protein
MNARARFTAAAVLTLLAWIPAVAEAQELTLSYVVLTSEQQGPVVTGTMRIEVANTGAGAMQNVDVRLATPGPNSIEKGVFQFGNVPARGSRAVTGRFTFDATSQAPLLWRIDSDRSTARRRPTARLRTFR